MVSDTLDVDPAPSSPRARRSLSAASSGYGRTGGRAAARRSLSPALVTIIVGSAGLLITVSVAWVAWTLNGHNERRLLDVQTRQAGAVLESTILSISDPLMTALQIEEATAGSVQQFKGFMSAYAGPGRLFVSASLWRVSGSSLRSIASVGAPPELSPASGRARAFVTLALHSTTFVVTNIRSARLQRIGYAVANPKSATFAVYAERAIPADREVPVESNSAFSDLNYATYLGSTAVPSDLATTDLSLAQLPLSRDSARDVIPFGDTTLTLVAASRGDLGGELGAELPWVFAAAGALLTSATAVAAEQLVRRRRDAELHVQTVTGLYDRLDGLYAEQRTIAESLQRALLPQYNPSIPCLEIASRYVAGADGVDIGGDWYSVVEVDEHRFAFAIGDVSGKGIGAAAIMARLRFTIRAYLLEGHPPHTVLEMCSRELDVGTDGHFSTVLAGIGDHESCMITLANAGHPDPLIISDTESGYARTALGPPLGVTASSYKSTASFLPPGSVLLAFTDGLVERRGETLDVGLQRLAGLARAPVASLEDLLSGLVSELGRDGSGDDVAVLAFRWSPETERPAR